MSRKEDYYKKTFRKQVRACRLLKNLYKQYNFIYPETPSEDRYRPFDCIIEYKDKMTPEMKKECWTLIDKYLRMVTTEKSNGLPANVIAVEKRFEFPVENVILNGAIDRIQLDDDNVVHVCDYKTSKNKEYQKKDFFQLLTYAYIIASEDPTIKRVRASYIMLRHNFEYITTEFSLDQILGIKDKYLEYARQIQTEEEYSPNPTALCSYCDFLEHCPEGKSKAYNNASVYGEVSY